VFSGWLECPWVVCLGVVLHSMATLPYIGPHQCMMHGITAGIQCCHELFETHHRVCRPREGASCTLREGTLLLPASPPYVPSCPITWCHLQTVRVIYTLPPGPFPVTLTHPHLPALVSPTRPAQDAAHRHAATGLHKVGGAAMDCARLAAPPTHTHPYHHHSSCSSSRGHPQRWISVAAASCDEGVSGCGRQHSTRHGPCV
jgi:hypothetical protein